jgi:long-chain fatty acid transport protein
MNYPAIISVGLGYTLESFDFAVDYRFVDYKNTDGFAESGWTQTGSVAGFGWENMNIISAGIQYKGIEKLPLRIGYTYSSNPITEELAFFSVSAPAVINNAFQLGLSFIASDNFSIDAMFHHGTSGETTGQLLSPLAIGATNPLGALPGTSVSYNMATDLIMVGASYTFNK